MKKYINGLFDLIQEHFNRDSCIFCGHDYVIEEIAALPTEFDWFGKTMGHGGVKKAVDEKFSDIKIYKDSSWAVKV